MKQGICKFCNLDKNQVVNTIIEETKSFYITPAQRALVEGYLLIISKRHIYSMLELDEEEKIEYLSIIRKYRILFFEKYNRYPIIFEHGTATDEEKCASSIAHAHTHIVNHNYKNEKDKLEKLNLKEIYDFSLEQNDKPYIFYINPVGSQYITYEFEAISQMMRIFIAEDLNIQDKYDWRKYAFNENIIKTIKEFKKFGTNG